MNALRCVLLSATCVAQAAGAPAPAPASAPSRPLVRLEQRGHAYVQGGTLYYAGRPMLLYGVEHDVESWLREDRLPLIRYQRFNTVMTRTPGSLRSPDLLAQIQSLKLCALPSIAVVYGRGPKRGRPTGRGRTPHLKTWLPSAGASQAVIGWHLGTGLHRDALGSVKASVADLRRLDPSPVRPIFVDARSGHEALAREVPCVGWHTYPCQVHSTTLVRYRDQLLRRAQQIGPRNLFWTFLQAHQTTSYAWGVTGLDPDDPTPYGAPDAEQLRLQVYLALSAGAKAILFPNALGFAEDHQGMDRLAEAGLIGCELALLGRGLADARTRESVACPGLDVTRLGVRGGSLLILVRCGATDHLVPDEGKVSAAAVRLPGMPPGARAYQLGFPTVADVTVDHREGVAILRPQMFYLTSVILVTEDPELAHRARQRMRGLLKDAANFAISMLHHKIEKVVRVKKELDAMGHARPQSTPLVAEARSLLKRAMAEFSSRNLRDAYDRARQGAALLRAVQRLYWEHAVYQVGDPAVSPYLQDYYVLPRHYRFSRRLTGATWGPNLLVNGSFEQTGTRVPAGWSRAQDPSQPRSGDLKHTTWRVKDGRRCVQLTSPGPVTVLGESMDLASVELASTPIPVRTGDVFRIEAWVFVPERIRRTRRGLIISPDLGARAYGEAFRLKPDRLWQRVVLYREVLDTAKAPSHFRLHIGLCGQGSAYVDQVRVQRMVRPATQAGRTP